MYDEDYFERGIEMGVSLYSNYRWMPELTIPMVSRMIEYLNIPLDAMLLDFGCAKGYMVRAFRLLGRKAFGVDKSSYAVESSPPDVRPFLSTKLDEQMRYDWMISKDVFEHFDPRELNKTLTGINKMAHRYFVVVPLGNEAGNYVIPAYERDLSHVIRQPMKWWATTFELCGFDVLGSTYGVPGVKENWSSYEKGNGFFTLGKSDDS